MGMATLRPVRCFSLKVCQQVSMANQLASLFGIAPVHGTSAALLTNMLH